MAVEHQEGNVENGGSKVHHVEDIVIVGGGIGGLGFAAALHKYVFITPPPN
jgi:NADH dehydrogenase FAD-containing subunit